MDLTKQERRARRRWGVIPKWFELLCICAATIAAGFFGGRETVVRADDPQPSVTVTATATATATVTATPGNGTNAATASPVTGGASPFRPEAGSAVYLADRELIDSVGDVSVVPVVMAGTHYAKSIRLGCNSSGESGVYSTSGYSRLTAEVGILADSHNAIGSAGSIQVANAAGNPIGRQLSIRSSTVQELSVDISGQDQIRITCVMTKSGDESATYFYSGLGDAELSRCSTTVSSAIRQTISSLKVAQATYRPEGETASAQPGRTISSRLRMRFSTGRSPSWWMWTRFVVAMATTEPSALMEVAARPEGQGTSRRRSARTACGWCAPTRAGCSGSGVACCPR